MKLFLLACTFFLGATTAFSYNPQLVNPERPYDVIAVEESPSVEQEFLGTLTGYPEMYEFTSDVPFDLSVKVRQGTLTEAEPVGLIIVRLDERGRGVTEVARLNKPPAEWNQFFLKSVGMSFIESDTIRVPVSEGTYRVEVSTPNNFATYMLVLGDEPSKTGYFSIWKNVHLTQKHFGYSFTHLIFSFYYYIPLLLLSVLIVVFVLKKHKRLTTKND